VIDHFASPSAAGGRLFVSTGSSVSAYQVAEPATEEPPPKESPKEISKAGTPLPAETTAPLLLHTHLHASSNGNVRVRLRCTGNASACRGTITLQARFVLAAKRGAHRGGRTFLSKLAEARFGPTHGDFGLTLHMDRHTMARLRHHKGHVSLVVTISAPGARARHTPAVLTLARR
jgi:hypothetical protein